MAIPGNFLSSTAESIEPNASGWRTRLNCTFVIGTGGRRGGPNTLGLRSVAAGEMQAQTAATYPIVPGETYFTFADAAGSVPERIGIAWLDAAGAEIGVTWSMVTASASSSLHRVSVAGRAPSTAEKARVVLSSSPTGAGVFHFWENVYLGVPKRTQGNLLPFNVESGGELDTSGWEPETNAAVDRTVPVQVWAVDWYLSGGHVVAMTAVAAGTAVMRCAERVVATAGTEYLAYVYLGPPTSSSQAWVELRFYDEAGGLLLSRRGVLAAPGTGMYRQRASAVAPAGTATAEVAVGLTGASAGQVLRVEGVVVTASPQIVSGTVVPYEDASFEAGVGQWTVVSGPGAIARTSPWGASGLEGSYALQVTSATAGTTVLRSGRYPVEPGASWRSMFHVRQAGAAAWQADIGIRWFDASGAEIRLDGFTGALPTFSTGAWRGIYDDSTAPENAATGQVELSLTATAASSVAHVDSVSLRQMLPVSTVVADPERARITITLRELVAGRLITVWRVGADGARCLVRGPDGMLERVPLASDILVVEDYEAPLGVEVQYYMEAYDASTGAVTSARWTASVSIDPGDGNWAWLKDPSMPHRNTRVLVQTAPEWTRPIAQAEYRVRGRRHPVILSDVRGGLTGALAIWTEDDDQREALHWLLDSGNTLLLQAAPGYGVDDMYVSVGEITEARTGGTAREPWRAWTLPLTAVDMPTAGVAGTAGRSWQDVLSEHTSWQQVLERYPTWEAVWLDQPNGG